MKGGGSVSPDRIAMRDVSDDGDVKYGSWYGIKIIVTPVTIVTGNTMEEENDK